MMTVVINTRNEEKRIGESVSSAKLLTDNVLVVDMHSTDKTREIAESQGAKVTLFPHTQYVEPARTFAIQESKTDWVFILDADECITKELADEIKKVQQESNTYTHYKVPRKNIFGNKKWLRHGGWWPDHQVRLIRRDSFLDWPSRIHSTPSIAGEIGFLNQPIIHYFHGNIEEMVEKTLNFENIESDLLYEAKKKATVITFFRKFYGEMWRRSFKSMGILDGKFGILESIYQSFSKTVTYLLLYEKIHKNDN
jgi:glycosyltransferase involved in cell wall biosynthesis